MRRIFAGLCLLIVVGGLLLIAPQVSSQPAVGTSDGKASPIQNDRSDFSTGSLAIHPGTAYGRLTRLEAGALADPNDVVIYPTLPDEMHRVAGIILEARQTPLSSVNLRAVQNNVPNVSVAKEFRDPTLESLIGKPVAYRVSKNGYQIAEATREQIESHARSQRPKSVQSVPTDLSLKQIVSLDEIEFSDSKSVGAKSANLAALGSIGLDYEAVPKGYAIPFYFYDQFMKHNGFYDYARQLLVNPQFRNDAQTRDDQLKKFRSLIKKGKVPTWMTTALSELHSRFPEGTSVRCRSSTNEEGLPGFCAAGLYDSYTHHPDEGHFSKSVKQVFASLWNYRAFVEREFYRVDHFSAAMGVLVHPNYKGEKADGVAATKDLAFQSGERYYVIALHGEDRDQDAKSMVEPEEWSLHGATSRSDQLLRQSNGQSRKRLILSGALRDELRDYLGAIHKRFSKLYQGSAGDDQFAMEVEFKVTKDRHLVIKQARRWASPNNAPAK